MIKQICYLQFILLVQMFVSEGRVINSVRVGGLYEGVVIKIVGSAGYDEEEASSKFLKIGPSITGIIKSGFIRPLWYFVRVHT